MSVGAGKRNPFFSFGYRIGINPQRILDVDQFEKWYSSFSSVVSPFPSRGKSPFAVAISVNAN